MLYYLVMTFFTVLCFVLGFFILLQQGKGDMGLGTMGGGSQTLFGGSGGQSFFEKATWLLGLLFMIIALTFSLWQSSDTKIGSYQKKTPAAATQPATSEPATQEAPAA